MLRHQNHIALVTAQRWDVDAVFAEMSARNSKLRPQWVKRRCTLSSKSFACGNSSIHEKHIKNKAVVEVSKIGNL